MNPYAVQVYDHDAIYEPMWIDPSIESGLPTVRHMFPRGLDEPKSDRLKLLDERFVLKDERKQLGD